jgi:hypothetical protein
MIDTPADVYSLKNHTTHLQYMVLAGLVRAYINPPDHSRPSV